jgi:glycine/D-amino acid oxidase-like deaminating enzyme
MTGSNKNGRLASERPPQGAYDVVIIGGAMIGSSAAWFLSNNPDFTGSILVVERDPSYEYSSTAHTNSCMRQQFSSALNIQISQFAAEFVRNFQAYMGHDPAVPRVHTHHFGYMYLAATKDFADGLRESHPVQVACGAATKLMSPAEIAAAYPFYRLDDILLGSHNLGDEGYFDGNCLFEWWRRKSRQNGVAYLANEVVDLEMKGGAVTGVRLASGDFVGAGTVVNAAGPRAAGVAQMAGLDIPVEPRPRYSFVFDAAVPLDRDLPLTIDPTGVHFRTDGRYYLAGCPPELDGPVDSDDFAMDHTLWETKAWPAIAHRVPAFERVKLVHSWLGHYAYNRLDQNAIIGRHPECANFIFVNGFSGHGFQQSPAMGRGVSELITYKEYRSLDLTPLGVERIIANQPLPERAVI